MKKTRRIISDQVVIDKIWCDFQVRNNLQYDGRFRQLYYSRYDRAVDQFSGFLLENGIHLARVDRKSVFEVVNEEAAMMLLLKYG